MQNRPLGAPFRRSVLIWLYGLSAASLAAVLAALIVEPRGETQSWGADSYSRSAIGHRAFVELLRASDVPVVVSRYASAERARKSALLAILEPRLEADDPTRARRLKAMIETARTTLLVLPKWSGSESHAKRGWLHTTALLGEETVARALRTAEVPANLTRPTATGSCTGGAVGALLPWPQLLVPTGATLRPLIQCEGGVLLAEMPTEGAARLLILTDPDLISNHGLALGNNADLALDVLQRARPAGVPVVLDETLHGFERMPSVWRELVTFPLWPATFSVVLALLALVWSGLPRFGAPAPDALSQASGKVLLLENVAGLQRSAGHSAHSLARYLEATTGEVARALHAPPGASSTELGAWLREAAQRRGTRRDLDALRRRVADLGNSRHPAPAAIVATARGLHRWKEEMLRGSQGSPRG
jgi:hypothetical protein